MRPSSGAVRGGTGRLGTAAGAGAGGLVGGSGDVHIAARPATQQGLAMRQGTSGQKRQVQDVSYFAGMLRSRISEIAAECARMRGETERAARDATLSVQLERRYEGAIKEVRLLEGELADYNLAMDKARTNVDAAEIGAFLAGVKRRNEAAAREVRGECGGRCFAGAAAARTCAATRPPLTPHHPRWTLFLSSARSASAAPCALRSRLQSCSAWQRRASRRCRPPRWPSITRSQRRTQSSRRRWSASRRCSRASTRRWTQLRTPCGATARATSLLRARSASRRCSASRQRCKRSWQCPSSTLRQRARSSWPRCVGSGVGLRRGAMRHPRTPSTCPFPAAGQGRQQPHAGHRQADARS